MNISRLIRGAAVAVVALAAFAFTSQSAQAQHFGHGHNMHRHGNSHARVIHSGSHYNNYYRPGVSISVGRAGFNFGYSSYPSYYNRPYYHNTTHYDYHPGGVVRHRNHFHYVPGHYDLHRTGHWHH